MQTWHFRNDYYKKSSTYFGDEKNFSCDTEMNMDAILAKEVFYNLKLEGKNYLKKTKR